MTAPDYLARQARLRSIAQQRDTDAVVLVPGPNMVYFTGMHFHLSERPTLALVLSGGGMAFLLPELEYTQLQPQLEPLDVRHVFRWTDTDGYAGAFVALGESLGLRGSILGVDDRTMRVFEWMALTAHIPALHVAAFGADLLAIRAIKTAAEVALLRQAIALSEAALADTLAALQVGMTERQIADVLTDNLRRHGSQGHAFGPIVLSGERSALPHGTPSDRLLADGDLLLFDFGGTVDGYPADITRTFIFGEASDRACEIHEVVRGANAAARAAVRPGVTAGEIDRIARAHIVAAGYGEAFTHRTGHGLGLDVHEMPNIAPDDDTVLAEGMVFTIEPGVYLSEVGGVRVEDNILVTADGGESLTTFRRDYGVREELD